MVHRTTQRAAEGSVLIASTRLSTAKDDLYPRMAAFSSAPGILSALRAAQTGNQVANVLIAKRLPRQWPTRDGTLRPVSFSPWVMRHASSAPSDYGSP